MAAAGKTWTAFALALASGCAGPPEAPSDVPVESPFIRRARREMVLALHWAGPAPSPGARQILARALEDRLRATYRVPIRVESATGRYPGLGPEALADWARAGIDDAIVIEARGGDPRPALGGRVRVIALATQDVLHDLQIPPPPEGEPAARLRRFADAIYIALSREWTAPGHAPEMDPLLAANRLHRKGACAHAVPLYDLFLEKLGPDRTDQIREHAMALERRRACRERLAVEARITRDRNATFSVETHVQGALPRVGAAVKASVASSPLLDALRSRTDKPAFVTVERSMLRLRLRHHPGGAGHPALEPAQVGAHIDLTPLLPVMRGLIDLRDLARARLPPDLGELLGTYGFAVELEHLDGDSFTIELADLDREPVISPVALLRVGREQMRIRARDPDLLRRKIFVLGPLEGPEGRPTEDALAASFLRE